MLYTDDGSVEDFLACNGIEMIQHSMCVTLHRTLMLKSGLTLHWSTNIETLTARDGKTYFAQGGFRTIDGLQSMSWNRFVDICDKELRLLKYPQHAYA
jgi:hypothetical protein